MGVMHIGISRPPTPPHPTPDVDGAFVAQVAEGLGFESIFYGEHPIRPVGQAGSGVHADGVPFFQDTLVMLARASALTSRIMLGGGVFLIPEHNAIAFAKQLASLDFYSGGRVIVGGGVGWSRVECELLGGNFERRWAQTRETVQLMKRLWTAETTEYHGEFYDVPPVQLFPKPATVNGPPVLLGARLGDRSFARIVEYADGWLPAFTTPESIAGAPEHLREGRSRLNSLAEQSGRDPASLQITAIVRGPQIDGDLGQGYAESVSPELLERLGEAGADRVAISLPTLTSQADAVAALERLAKRVL
jgi:probable F420-dependent oxidoreductase